MLLPFILTLLMPSNAVATDLNALEGQLQYNRASNAVNAHDLAVEIHHVASDLHLDERLLAALVLTESRGVATAYNRVSHDHGLLQINTRTAIEYRISVKCLYDWRCNLRKGAWIFSKGHRPCLYNLGVNRIIEGKFVAICEAYEDRLASLY